VELWAQWAYRIAALLLAGAAGWLVGQGRPSWRSDRFKEVEQHPQASLMDLSDVSGVYGGRLSMLPGALGNLSNSSTSSSFISCLLILLALVCAANGWPPLRIDPLRASPFEFVALLLFQRWLWFTLAAFLLGCLSGGAAALTRKDWFH